MSLKRRPPVRQSPIDIQTKSVVCDTEKCTPIMVRFTSGDCHELTLAVSGDWKVHARHRSSSSLRGTHLPGIYRLQQFHAHWGGSEHTVDGRQYAGEIHFVYWNTRYPSPEEACKRGDGIAVLGVFIEEGKENEAMATLLESIERAAVMRKPARIPPSFDPMRLIPKTGLSRFFTYLGGLTTPPYSECVVWTVLQTPIQISPQQLEALQKLTPSNFRECQKLAGRRVHSSRKAL